MAFVERYANFDLTTGANNGTSEADAWQTPAAILAGVIAGDRVNIKRTASPYIWTTTVDFNVNGTALKPIHYRAYASTIGDGGMLDVEFTNSINTIANLLFTGAFNYVEGINFYPNAASNLHFMQVSGVASWAIRCYFATRGGNPNVANALACVFDLDTVINSNTFVTIANTNTANSSFISNVVRQSGSASTALQLVSRDAFDTAFIADGNILIGKGFSNQHGFRIGRVADQRGLFIHRNIFHNLHHGISLQNAASTTKRLGYICRNLFNIMAGYGIKTDVADTGYMTLFDNYYRLCTSGLTDLVEESILKPGQALSADPFVNAAGGDFQLNTTAGGGQVLRDAGFNMDPRGTLNYPVEPFAQWWEESAGGSGGSDKMAAVYGF